MPHRAFLPARAVLVSIVVAAFAVACGGGPAEPDAYRVASRLISPDSVPGAPQAATPTAPLYQTLRRGNVYRLAATLPAGEAGATQIVWDVGRRSGTTLRFGFGLDDAASGASDAVVVYEVAARRPGAPDLTIYSASAPARELVGGVRTQEVRLPDLADDAQLVLSTSVQSPDPPGSLVVHWFDPVVLEPVEAERRRNVLIVMVDTLRPDRLATFGGAPGVMPNLDRRLADAAVFTRGYANASWTLPSVATLMTGLYPGLHNAGRRTPVGPASVQTDYSLSPVDGGFELTINRERYRYMMLHRSIPTLASLLAANGYATAAIHDNGYLNQPTGVMRGMQTVRDVGRADARVSSDAAISWLRAHQDTEFFFFLHYIDPHQWITAFDSAFLGGGPAGLSDEDRARILDRYDALCRYTDEHVERVLAELERLGLADDTHVVFLADHAERFFTGGVIGSHGGSHRDDVLRVPLAAWSPDLPAGRIDTRVSLVDVAPTVLDLLDLGTGDLQLSGDSLLPLTEGRLLDDREVVGEFVLWPQPQHEQMVLFRGPWKYVHYPNRQDADQLFAAGPDAVPDADNVIGAQPDTAADLLERIRRHLDIATTRFQRLSYDTPPVDEETLRSLRALGYIR